MSFIRYNNAEGTVSGTTLTVANSGGASGYAFDTVPAGTTYDNAQFFTGTQSHKMVMSAGNAYVKWSIPAGSYGAGKSIYSRFYIRFQTSVFTNTGLYNILSTPTGMLVTVASGKLAAVIFGNVTTSGTITLSADTWYRVETQANFSTISPSIVVRLYDASGTLLETITATGSAVNSVNPAGIDFGSSVSATTGTMWIDEPAVSDRGWIGTAVGSAVGPLSKANNGAGGTPTVAISPANTGGISGDAIDLLASGSITFDTANVRPSGSPISYKPNPASGGYTRWVLPGTLSTIYLRAYVLMTSTANPFSPVYVLGDAGTHAASISFGFGHWSTGLPGASSTGTTTPVINTWYRVELQVIFGAGTAQTIARIYDAASGSLLETITSPATGTIAAPQFASWGNVSGGTTTMCLDSIAVSDQGWIGPAPNLPPYTLLDQLHDSHLDTTKWSGAYGTLSYGQNGVTITNPIGYTGYGGFNSISSYDYTGWSAFARCVSAGNQVLASLEVFPVQLKLDASNAIGFYVNGGNVSAYQKVATSVTLNGTVTYNSTTHKWFRIRESGGTTYWETSPDSQTWNAFYSTANPFAMTSLQFVISAGTYASEASATTVVIDMVNSPAAILPVGGQFNRYNNAEGQPSGTAVTTANSGGTSGYAIDSLGGAGGHTFDNSQFFTGTQSYKLVTAANGSQITTYLPNSAGPGAAMGPGTFLYARCYVRWQTSVFANTYLVNLNTTGPGSLAATVGVASSKLNATCAGGTPVNGVTTLSADVWYRIETQYTFSNTSPSMAVRLYNAAGTLLETIIATNAAVMIYPSSLAFGAAIITTGTMWIDEPAISSAGWIGTAVGSAVGPVSKANNASGGVNGVALTTSNTGGASGDAFDAAGTFAGALSFSWQNPRRGSSPLDYYSTGGGYYAGWNIPGNITNLYSRFYFFNQAGTNKTVFGIQTTASIWAVVNTGVQKLAFSGAFVLNGTYTMLADTWYRLDIRWSQPASGIGFVECYLYDIDGNQLDHFIGLMTTIPAISVNRAIGYGGTVDSLAISDQGWIGPAADIPTITSRKGAMFMDVMG